MTKYDATEEFIVEGKFVKKLDDVQLHCRASFSHNSVPPMGLVGFTISCYPKNNIHKYAPMKIHQSEEHLYEIIGECKADAHKKLLANLHQKLMPSLKQDRKT